jgi:hypothetical protein
MKQETPQEPATATHSETDEPNLQLYIIFLQDKV